ALQTRLVIPKWEEADTLAEYFTKFWTFSRAGYGNGTNYCVSEIDVGEGGRPLFSGDYNRTTQGGDDERKFGPCAEWEY
ncbi:hypothetical protein, partial [Escherichia coli]|uniref:hypothetical protein n=1 Tax=Escherichia coli TaxID=562 RepID=UPI003CFF7A5B